MIGSLFKAAGKFFGSGSTGSLFSGVLDIGSRILGWAEDNPLIVGNVAGAVGVELMKPTAEDRAEEARRLMQVQEDERRKRIRSSYGLPETPAATSRYTPAYKPRGLLR